MDANMAFATAMRYERRQMWTKAIKSYRELLKRLRAIKLDENIDANSLRLLLYESHFHCGVAYHHVEKVSDAVKHFVAAMKAVSRKKIGCGAGCITGKVLHLHVPALAKMAVCRIQQGQYDVALREIEEALVLDFKNPDLFCIRATAFYLLKLKAKAMKDVNYSIWLNPKQVCGWLLRGIFKNVKSEECGYQPSTENPYFKMACSYNVEALAFTNTTDVASCSTAIFNKFLPSLRVCHTVSIDEVLSSSKEREASNNSFDTKHHTKQRDCYRNKSATSSRAFVCGNARPPRSSSRRLPLASYAIMPHSSTSHHVTSTPILSTRDIECRSSLRSAPSRLSRITKSSDGRLTLGDILDAELHTGYHNKAMTSHIFRQTYGGHLLPSRLITTRQEMKEEERQYPRAWTQNTVPVQIPDIHGCRTLNNDEFKTTQ